MLHFAHWALPGEGGRRGNSVPSSPSPAGCLYPGRGDQEEDPSSSSNSSKGARAAAEGRGEAGGEAEAEEAEEEEEEEEEEDSSSSSEGEAGAAEEAAEEEAEEEGGAAGGASPDQAGAGTPPCILLALVMQRSCGIDLQRRQAPRSNPEGYQPAPGQWSPHGGHWPEPQDAADSPANVSLVSRNTLAKKS